MVEGDRAADAMKKQLIQPNDVLTVMREVCEGMAATFSFRAKRTTEASFSAACDLDD